MEIVHAGSSGSLPEIDDATPPTTPGATSRVKERWGKAAAAAFVVVCLVVLPYLGFLFGGSDSERASILWKSASAKLAAMRGGLSSASHGHSVAGARASKVDELLGGLLTPGFNRSSCLSRYQLSQYYKHHPYAPSPYLLQKLRKYEARHKKCGPGTPLYAKSVEQLRSGRSTEVMECNYALWLPLNGLGNLMLSLMSVFVYALLTDRVVLVHSPGDFAGLFCEPFPDTTWVLPPDFPIPNLSHLGTNPEQSYRNLVGSKKIVNDPANATVQSLPPYVFSYHGDVRQDMDNLFYCGEDQQVLAKVNWILFYSDLYFAPSMYTMPAFKDEFQRLFPAKESISHLLARYLFRPSNPVWGLVTRFYRSYLAHATQIIGLQIRMYSHSSIPADDMYKQILACSRQEQHILPEVDGDEPLAGSSNDGTANATASGGAAAAAGSKAILIASLYADYYERIKSRYYEHAAKGGAAVGVFQPSHEQQQETGRLAHDQKALADIYLLSFSDELVTSGLSTFGYMIHSLAGLRPAVLFPAFGHKVPETPCVRAASMEACNLTPPDPKCRGEGLDKEELARHVKVCEDWAGGIKLFD